jgi:hypothetical protein
LAAGDRAAGTLAVDWVTVAKTAAADSAEVASISVRWAVRGLSDPMSWERWLQRVGRALGARPALHRA